MAGPRRPERPPGELPDPDDPMRPEPIDPGPIRPRPPRPPVPWTPFGPGDNAAPDVAGIVGRAEKTMEMLRRAQLDLTRMKSGPGPDGTDPVVEEVNRADGLWPYLLIRHDVGDVGARPLDADIRSQMADTAHWSPDILVTRAGPPGEPVVIDRGGIPALQARVEWGVTWGVAYDIWVHVWNLGAAPATGVRVRAFLSEVDRFIGGRQLDLGDRLSQTCHRVVKVTTYTPGTSGESTWTPLVVVAECLSDVASGDRSPGMDRHCAQSWLAAN
jgi:hypothetical protein